MTRRPIHHRHCFGSKASLHDRPVKRLTTTGQPQAAEPSPRSCFPSKQQLLVCSSAAESTKLSCATGAELDPGTQPGFLVATGFFNRELEGAPAPLKADHSLGALIIGRSQAGRNVLSPFKDKRLCNNSGQHVDHLTGAFGRVNAVQNLQEHNGEMGASATGTPRKGVHWCARDKRKMQQTERAEELPQI